MHASAAPVRSDLTGDPNCCNFQDAMPTGGLALLETDVFLERILLWNRQSATDVLLNANFANVVGISVQHGTRTVRATPQLHCRRDRFTTQMARDWKHLKQLVHNTFWPATFGCKTFKPFSQAHLFELPPAHALGTSWSLESFRCATLEYTDLSRFCLVAQPHQCFSHHGGQY